MAPISNNKNYAYQMLCDFSSRWYAATSERHSFVTVNDLQWVSINDHLIYSTACFKVKLAKKWLAGITYRDWFLFQICSSSDTESQASSFFFVQDYKVCVFFALAEKRRWRGGGRRRKTKPKDQDQVLTQVTNPHYPQTMAGEKTQQLKELKQRHEMHFRSWYND